MNPYLTQKAERGILWRTLVALLCAYSVVASICLLPEPLAKREWIDVFAALFVMLCFLLPLVRLTRGVLLRLDARRMARSLAGRLEDGIPLEKLNAELRMHGLPRRLQRAIDGGFLQNVCIDFERNRVVLTAPAPHASQGEIIVVECPSCGAKNQTVAGRLGRCSFCNQPLMAHVQGSGKGDAR